MLNLAYLPEQSVLARAFTYGKQRQWREVATLLDSLQCTAINDTVRYFAGRFFHESRRILGAWAEICNDSCATYGNVGEPRLECLHAQEPATGVAFGKSTDTIAISIKRGIPIVPVVVNGKEYEFLFDTGAQQTVVYDVVVQESAVRVLAEQEYKVGSPTERVYTARAGLINSLSVANAKFTNLPCYVFDAKRLEQTWLFFTLFSCDGILGWDVIKHLDVTIDYANSRLIVRRPYSKELHPQLPSLLWVEHPLVYAKTTSGLPLLLLFDSGASHSSLVADVITQKIPDMAITEIQRTVTTVGGEEQQDSYTTHDFSFYLSGHQFAMDAVVVQKEKNSLMALDGVLGGDVFQEGAVHLDYTNGIFEFIAE